MSPIAEPSAIFRNIADGSAIGDIVNGTFKAMQLYTNSTAEISSYGAVIGGSFKFAEDFVFGANYTYAKFDFDQSSNPGLMIDQNQT